MSDQSQTTAPEPTPDPVVDSSSQPVTTSQPMPEGAAVEKWKPPLNDEEFKFEGMDTLPSWVDRNWASYDRGPALAVPAGDVYGKPPYHTTIARLGDTVKFVAATASKAAHFVVIPGEPSPENSTKKIPQVSNASLEDMLKGGTITSGDLGDDAKGQVAMRSPELAKLAESGEGAPEPVPVADVMKVG